MDDALPIKCPYCKKEFDTAQGVDSHFAFNSGHPTEMSENLKSQIQKAANNTELSKQLSEQDIINEWVSSAYPDECYLTEVPVSTEESDSIKMADILLISGSHPITISEFVAGSIKKSSSLKPSGEDRVRTLLSQFSDDSIDVRVFEAKKKLNFKSIGQVLAYSEILPDYYNEEINMTVIEKGIIFAEDDPFCRSVAEKYGIQLHQVDS